MKDINKIVEDVKGILTRTDFMISWYAKKYNKTIFRAGHLNKIGCNYFLSLKELNSKIQNRHQILSFDFFNTKAEQIKSFSSRYDFKQNKTLNQKKLSTF